MLTLAPPARSRRPGAGASRNGTTAEVARFLPAGCLEGAAVDEAHYELRDVAAGGVGDGGAGASTRVVAARHVQLALEDADTDATIARAVTSHAHSKCTSRAPPRRGRSPVALAGRLPGASASRSPRTLKIFRRAQRQSESGGIRTVEANKTLARLAVDHRDGGLLAAESLDL